MARWAPLLAAAVLLASQARASSAQNLLANPDFGTNLNGWFSYPITSWDGTLDAGGSPNSGSAKGVFNGQIDNGIYPVVSQCVPLSIGVTYHFGGDVYISPGQTVSGGAFFSLSISPNVDCGGEPPPTLFVLTTPPVTFAGAWTSSTLTFTNSTAQSGYFSAILAPATAGRFQVNFDDVVVAPGALGCNADASTLCLLGSRFRITTSFHGGAGGPSTAQAVPIGNGGAFWFFDPSNAEVLVKMADGCALGGHFWFFAAGLTNVEMAITVTDTQTGAHHTYTNPSNTAFQPIQDTAAFPCP